jgi:transposase
MQHLLKRKEGMRLVELSSIEIAEWFHKSERTIQRWIKQGKLKPP